MIKKFFSSAWPADVALCVGAVTFLVGNFFGHYLPEGWLVPLAWGSSIALFLGLLFAVSLLVCYDQEVLGSFIDSGQLLAIGGALFALVGSLLESYGWTYKQFIDIPVFFIQLCETSCLACIFCAIGWLKKSKFFAALICMVMAIGVAIIFKERIPGMALKEMLEYALLVLLAGFVIFAVWLPISKYQEGKKKLIVQEK